MGGEIELLGLSVRICFSPAADLSLIFADPRMQAVKYIHLKYHFFFKTSSSPPNVD